MKDVQLVTLDPAIEQMLTRDPTYLDAMVQNDWAQVAQLVHQFVGRTLNAAPESIDALQWGGYFVVDARTQEVVGSCAFKGQPLEDGTVEIAYFTYPDFAGRGYATSMASKLIKLAASDAAVKRVVAHTLTETNASTRVLEKAALNFVGEVIDPEDGLVWQWQAQVRA